MAPRLINANAMDEARATGVRGFCASMIDTYSAGRSLQNHSMGVSQRDSGAVLPCPFILAMAVHGCAIQMASVMMNEAAFVGG